MAKNRKSQVGEARLEFVLSNEHKRMLQSAADWKMLTLSAWARLTLVAAAQKTLAEKETKTPGKAVLKQPSPMKPKPRVADGK